MDVSRLLFLLKQENNLIHTFDGGGICSTSTKLDLTNIDIAKSFPEKKIISSKKNILHKDSTITTENCSKRKDLNFEPTTGRRCGEKCIKLEHDIDVGFSRIRRTIDSNENLVLSKDSPNNNKAISSLSSFLNYIEKEDGGSLVGPDIERTYDDVKKTSLSLSQLLEETATDQKSKTNLDTLSSSTTTKDESLSSLLQDFAFDKKGNDMIIDGEDDDEDEDDDDEDLECYNYDDEITPERLVNDEHLTNLKPCPRIRSKSVSPNFVQRQKVLSYLRCI